MVRQYSDFWGKLAKQIGTSPEKRY